MMEYLSEALRGRSMLDAVEARIERKTIDPLTPKQIEKLRSYSSERRQQWIRDNVHVTLRLSLMLEQFGHNDLAEKARDGKYADEPLQLLEDMVGKRGESQLHRALTDGEFAHRLEAVEDNLALKRILQIARPRTLAEKAVWGKR